MRIIKEKLPLTLILTCMLILVNSVAFGQDDAGERWENVFYRGNYTVDSDSDIKVTMADPVSVKWDKKTGDVISVDVRTSGNNYHGYHPRAVIKRDIEGKFVGVGSKLVLDIPGDNGPLYNKALINQIVVYSDSEFSRFRSKKFHLEERLKAMREIGQKLTSKLGRQFRDDSILFRTYLNRCSDLSNKRFRRFKKYIKRLKKVKEEFENIRGLLSSFTDKSKRNTETDEWAKRLFGLDLTSYVQELGQGIDKLPWDRLEKYRKMNKGTFCAQSQPLAMNDLANASNFLSSMHYFNMTSDQLLNYSMKSVIPEFKNFVSVDCEHCMEAIVVDGKRDTSGYPVRIDGGTENRSNVLNR